MAKSNSPISLHLRLTLEYMVNKTAGYQSADRTWTIGFRNIRRPREPGIALETSRDLLPTGAVSAWLRAFRRDISGLIRMRFCLDKCGRLA